VAQVADANSTTPPGHVSGVATPLKAGASEIEIEFPPRGGTKGGVTKTHPKRPQAILGSGAKYDCDFDDDSGL
jgi:hypothetical protein